MPSKEPGEFREPRTAGAGMTVLAVVSAITVVVAAFWVMGRGRDPDPTSSIVATPSTPSPSHVTAPVDLNDRTVYLWDTATGHFRTVAFGPGLGDPELSPDGEQVVYEREEADGLTQIYLLDAEGTEHRLTDFPNGASDPTWSPDGRIAFSAMSPAVAGGYTTDTDIFVMDADGSHVRKIAGTIYDDLSPDWSPDGSRVAFHNQSDGGPGMIWVASTETSSNQRPRPLHEAWSAMAPAWSPNGRWIAYSRYKSGNTLNGQLYSAELWLVRPDGSGRRRLSIGSAGIVRGTPSWSPDGRLIVFEQYQWDGSDRRVSVINAQTRLTRPFLKSTPGSWWVDFEPSWGSQGVLVIRPSVDPILTQPPLPMTFGSPPVFGEAGIDAVVRMKESRCQLEGAGSRIRPGKLTLELINESIFEAHFTLVKLKGSFGDLREDVLGHSWHFLFRRAWQRSLDPSTFDEWSSTNRLEPGRWAVVCHKDKAQEPNGFLIVPVGVAGPLIVG